MKLKLWFYTFALFGLVGPAILLLLQRSGTTVSPTLVVGVWPTFILAAMGVLGKTLWWAWGFTMLLNGICWGLFGYLSGRLWQKIVEITAKRSDGAM